MDRIRRLLSPSKSNGYSASDRDVDENGEEVGGLIANVKKICGAIHEEDLNRNMEMGNGHGESKKGLKVLTVCNTGSLATSV